MTGILYICIQVFFLKFFFFAKEAQQLCDKKQIYTSTMMELNITDTQLYEALRARIGKEEAELLVTHVKLQVKHEVESQMKGLATNERLGQVETRIAQLETALVREFNNKLLVYSMGTVVATIISLIVLAKFFIK
jgi:hypothetical protein